MDKMDSKDHKDDDFIDDTLPDVSEGETARVVDHIAERQLCRKFDVRLMPVLAVMCTPITKYSLTLLTCGQICSMH